ncbi:MAG: hypothetical protein IKM59_03880 [Oscillospiraceae bacterium]|nr:hypothetical protein [Oscillospiraceae bacterium]
MTALRTKTEKLLYIACGGIIALFLLGFLWINLHSNQWYNADLYADAMVAKHMVLDKHLFPRDWIYGNQLYLVATPVVAAVLYPIIGDSVLSLGIASCIMTGLTVVSFLWCIGPFTGKRSKCLGLLFLVGGALFGTSAAADAEGLQVFFTMGSYYSCYMIGIFLTLGVWLRLKTEQRVSLPVVGAILLLNLLLSMQSLREMLVLNLPLLTLGVLCSFKPGEKLRLSRPHKSLLFALGALLMGLLGLLLIKGLTHWLPIHQVRALIGKPESLTEGIKHNVKTLIDYMGLVRPVNLHGKIRLFSALFCLATVLYCTVEQLWKKRSAPLTALLLYGWLSVAAVFCAGLLAIGTRPIYYFPWHILVAFGAVCLGERSFRHGWIKSLLLCLILAIGTSSFYFNFRTDLRDFASKDEDCRATAELLLAEDVTHIYYDGQRIFSAPQLGAYSHDELVVAPAYPNPRGIGDGDLLRRGRFLSSHNWYALEDPGKAYFLLSEKSLNGMDEEYKNALLSHLTLKLQCTHMGVEFYFYSMDEALLQDLYQFWGYEAAH